MLGQVRYFSFRPFSAPCQVALALKITLALALALAEALCFSVPPTSVHRPVPAINPPLSEPHPPGSGRVDMDRPARTWPRHAAQGVACTWPKYSPTMIPCHAVQKAVLDNRNLTSLLSVTLITLCSNDLTVSPFAVSLHCCAMRSVSLLHFHLPLVLLQLAIALCRQPREPRKLVR